SLRDGGGNRAALRARRALPAWRRDDRESRTDISQVELQLHGLRVAPRRGLHQLRREDRGADPRVRPQRARHRAVLGCLPRGNRAVLLHAARALARAAHTTQAVTIHGGRSTHCLASPLASPLVRAARNMPPVISTIVMFVCAASAHVNVGVLYQFVDSATQPWPTSVAPRRAPFPVGQRVARSLPERWPADLPRANVR